jgi:hypothetical protein
MHDLLADLPAPRDDEPASLRQDILDELSDHLSCAFHRELVKSGDEQTAKERVLDRFGDPRRIALQLWFQAMWSRIMLQRVSLGLQGLLVVGVLAVAFLMFRVLDAQSRQQADWQRLQAQSASNQQMLAQLLQRLPEPPNFGMSGAMEASPDAGGMSMGGYDAEYGGEGMAGMPGGMGAPGMAGGAGMVMGAGMMPGGGGAGKPQPPPNLIVHVVQGNDKDAPAQGYILEVQNENGQGIPVALENDGGYGGMSGGGSGYGGMSGGEGGMGGMPGGGVSGLSFARDGRPVRAWVDQPQPKGTQYRNVPPGRYTAIVEFPDGRVGKQRFAVLPKEVKTVSVVSPPAVEPSLVTIVGPKLEQIDPAFEIRAGVTITRAPQKLDNTEWTVKETPSWEVWFDPATGQTTSLYSPAGPHSRDNPRQRSLTFDASDPPDTRFVSLKSGEYRVDWKFQLVHKVTSSSGNSMGNVKTEFTVDQPTSMTFTATPGTDTWTLTTPEALQEKLKTYAKDLVPQDTPSTPATAPTNAEPPTSDAKNPLGF